MWLHYNKIIMFATTYCLNTTYLSSYGTSHYKLKRQHNIKVFLYQTSSLAWHQRQMKKLYYSWIKETRALLSDCICSLPLEHSWSYTSLFLIYIISKQANPKYTLIKWTKASISHNKKGLKKNLGLNQIKTKNQFFYSAAIIHSRGLSSVRTDRVCLQTYFDWDLLLPI